MTGHVRTSRPSRLRPGSSERSGKTAVSLGMKCEHPPQPTPPHPVTGIPKQKNKDCRERNWVSFGIVLKRNVCHDSVCVWLCGWVCEGVCVCVVPLLVTLDNDGVEVSEAGDDVHRDGGGQVISIQPQVPQPGCIPHVLQARRQTVRTDLCAIYI